MRLAHAPESIERMMARYADAVREVTDAESVVLGLCPAPGETRLNTFDFDDGVRMVVSRDKLDESKPVVHFSASIDEGSDLYRQILRGRRDLRWFRCEVVRRFRSLSGDRGRITFLGLSPEKGVPHFIVEE